MVFGAPLAASGELVMSISCRKALCQVQPAHTCIVLVKVKPYLILYVDDIVCAPDRI